MSHRIHFLCCWLAGLTLSLASCDNDGLDVLDIEVPAGYALSAGTSTIFLNSSVAYDSELIRYILLSLWVMHNLPFFQKLF